MKINASCNILPIFLATSLIDSSYDGRVTFPAMHEVHLPYIFSATSTSLPFKFVPTIKSLFNALINLSLLSLLKIQTLS